MAELIIEGGARLEGTILVGGCKNATLPIIAASLLTNEPCTIKNVPQIGDVAVLLDIIKSLGGVVSWDDTHTVTINASGLHLEGLDRKAAKRIRSAILLLPALLARFNHVEIPEPGGCVIGKRPLDTHLTALSGFGITVARAQDGYSFSRATISGSTIILPELSVTATENALMLASVAQGESTIRMAAVEPHVLNLIEFLRAMGATIELKESNVFHVRGTTTLHGAEITIIPDRIEAGTLAVLAATTRSNITITPIIPEHMDSILTALTQAGVLWEVNNNQLIIHKTSELKNFKIKTQVYPGFPTDLQAPFGVLATQATGTSLIHDSMYEGRMGYVNELAKMGADAIIADPHRVIITGPTPLFGNEIRSLDLRAGATLVIAGLAAQGETHIYNAEQIDRGYEQLDERLRALGARIKRIS